MLVFTPTDEPITTESDYPPPDPEYRHSGVQIFGQPYFVQQEAFPSYKGRAAYLLWNRETGYGDIEIENVFIALDDEGLPCKAWSEASQH